MPTGFMRLLRDGDPVSGMQPSDMTPQDCFTGSDRTELNHTFFATPDEAVTVGVWECAPSKEEIESYPVHEMMTVISGSVTLTDANGHKETFAAGDSFFIPKGTKCTWEITQTLRKFYMINAG